MLMIMSALLCSDAVATMTGDYQKVPDWLAETQGTRHLGGSGAEAGFLGFCVQVDKERPSN